MRDNVRRGAGSRGAESQTAERRLQGEGSRRQCLHRALGCPSVAGEGKGKEARGLCRSLKQPVSFNGTQGGSCGFNSSLGFATGMSLSMQKPP